MTKVKLCVFDLDGTLVNTIGDIAQSGNHALAKNNFMCHPQDAYNNFVGDGVKKLIERMLGGAVYGQAEFENVYRDYTDHYGTHFLDNSVPYDGICEVLDRLRREGILLGVLSNKSDEFAREMVLKLFSGYQFVKILGDKAGYPLKPDPETLFLFLKEADVTKEECIFIGDTNVDVKTAHNAGIKCIGAAWGFRGREELRKAGADFIADTTVDLLRYIVNKRGS